MATMTTARLIYLQKALGKCGVFQFVTRKHNSIFPIGKCDCASENQFSLINTNKNKAMQIVAIQTIHLESNYKLFA